eukprot:gnl/TRDRNA2_/TRDRNA2_174417_c1_seq31.p1 gnl/TRDRNA2_/TRDRNA2_174417_c1~~gnl/TRDRNA2_/TRDRNA2_174417_c1_seq31.p1  ORF type:complete len:190 (-),score=46.24 gnl/TRDRNA2_/TRDRNA2_174417_c1_seq31:129-698(-)
MKAVCVLVLALTCSCAGAAELRATWFAKNVKNTGLSMAQLLNPDQVTSEPMHETNKAAPAAVALKAKHPLTDVGKDQWPTKHDPRSLNPPAAHKEAAKKDKLLPIGEGAYQDPEAVAQRTLDSSVRCEKTQANTDAIVDCWKEKGDYLDGHVYGNYQHPKAAPPPVKAGAAATGLGFAVAMITAVSLRM